MFKQIYDYITYFIATYIYRFKVVWLGADVPSLTLSQTNVYTDINDFTWSLSNASEETFPGMVSGTIALDDPFNQYDLQIMARCKATGDGNRYCKITLFDASDSEVNTRSATISIPDGDYALFNLTHRFTADYGYKIKIQFYGNSGDVFDFTHVNMSATRNTVSLF